MDKEKRDFIKKGSCCLILFFGISFVLSSVGVILTLVFGGSLREYFTDSDGEDRFWWFKAQFWIIIGAIILLLLAGGKLRNLNFPEIYKEDDEDS